MKYTMYVSLFLIISVSSVVAMETSTDICKKAQQARYKALLMHSMEQLHELMASQTKIVSLQNEMTALIAVQNELLKLQSVYLKELVGELLPVKQSRLKSRSKHD